MPNDNIQKAKHHLEAAGENAKDEAQDRLSDANDGYHEIKGQAKAKLSDTAQKLQKGCESVKGYVKSNPLTALGIAAAIGMGLATLLNRSK